MSTKEIKGRYIVKNYFQKSKHLLFPLLNTKQEGLINTYLFAEYIENEGILEYKLFCEIKKGVEIKKELSKYLTEAYETEDGTDLCIFDIEHLKTEVELFLKGEYSNYPENKKHDILKYYGWHKNGKVINVAEVKRLKGDTALHYYVFLYPSQFINEIAEDLVNLDMYNTISEAKETIKKTKEFATLYDLEKETFTKKIV